MTPEPSPKKPAASRAWIIAAIVFVLGFDLAFLWQRRAGATASEFGAHPDEAAHYISGLLEGRRSSADNSAPIIRPSAPAPLFHEALGAWTSAFGKSRTSVLLLMCLFAALIAMLLHIALRRDFGEAAAVIAAALFLSLPLVREHTATLLPALPVALFMFAAALAFARLLEHQRLVDGFWFGLCATLALLTDRAALALLLFLPLALALSGKWRLLARPGFWYGILLLALPVTICPAADWEKESFDFTRVAAPFYAGQFAAATGLILLLITVPSLLAKICRPAERTPFWSAAAALLVSTIVFHILFSTTLDAAHLLPALPPALLFATTGCAVLAKRFGRSTGFILLIAGVLTIALSESVMVTWRGKKWSGFQSLAEIVLESSERSQARILVCSDPTGEGMFISEIAMHEPQPGRIIERADALFASTRFSEDDELANVLVEKNFDYIVFDESNPDLDRASLHNTLRRVLREKSDRFWEMSSSPVIRDGIAQDGHARLYRVMGRTDQ